MTLPENPRRFYENASLSYETSLTTLRALPRSTALQYADRIYADLYMADQLRRRAETYMGGTNGNHGK